MSLRRRQRHRSAPPISANSLVALLLVATIDNELTSCDLVQDLLMSILEGLLESVLNPEESGSTGSLLLASSLGSLGLKTGDASLGSSSLGLVGSGLKVLGSWVESLHLDLVGEWVLLSLVGDDGSDSLLSELALDLVRVDNSSEISNRHHWSGELESGLLDGSLSVGTEDLVELLEGVLGENNKSSHVTTWGELEEIQSGDVASVNSWEVSGGSLHNWIGIAVDDEWSLLEGEAGGSHLTLSWSHSLGSSGAVEVVRDSDLVEGGEHTLGGVSIEGVNNKWELWDVVDSVSSGLDEWSTGGSGEGGGNGVSLLVEVHLSVPLSPDLEWCKQSSLAAHVTESSLSGSVGTRS